MNEQILTGKKYRVLADEATGLWNRISFWNKAADTELNSGKTVEEVLASTPVYSETIATASATPRDADTLAGHQPNYYATQADLTTSINAVNNSLTNLGQIFNPIHVSSGYTQYITQNSGIYYVDSWNYTLDVPILNGIGLAYTGELYNNISTTVLIGLADSMAGHIYTKIGSGSGSPWVTIV